MLASLNEAYIKLMRAKKMILKEGGNIFKDEQGTPVTQRIARNDVDPTLAWLEKITGLNHTDMKLGSTGIKDTSGDLDVAIDASKVDKQELFDKLMDAYTSATTEFEIENEKLKKARNIKKVMDW